MTGSRARAPRSTSDPTDGSSSSRPTSRCSVARAGRCISAAASRPTRRTPRSWRSMPPRSGRNSRARARSGASRSTSWPPPTAGEASGVSTRSRSTCGRAARRTRTRRCATSRQGATTPAPAAGSPRTAAPAATAQRTTSSTRRGWVSACLRHRGRGRRRPPVRPRNRHRRRAPHAVRPGDRRPVRADRDRRDARRGRQDARGHAGDGRGTRLTVR